MSEPRIARLPDGSMLRFPAETPDDVMDAAVQRHVQDTAGRQENAAALPGEGLQRSIIRGATFGLADEFSAGVRATAQGIFGTGEGNWSDRYTAALGRERGRDRAYAEDNPVTSTVGNLVGGVLGPGVALSGPSAGAGVVQRVVRSVPVRGAVAGATGGAATGFGEGEGGAVDRAQGALTGGLIGAGTGAALAAGTNLAARVGGRVADVFGMRNPELAADRQVLRALERDGVTPRDLAIRLSEMPDATTILPDAAGRNTVNLAAVAANTPGRAQELADQATLVRRAGAPDRIAAASNAAFGGGSGDDVAVAVRALQDRRAQAARPLYERAWRIELSPQEFASVSRFIDDPIGQDALRQGMRVVQIEHLARGQPFNPADYGLTRGEGGNWVPAEGATPNMRLMDAVKRGFDEIVEGFRDPVTGRLNLNQYGNAVNQARAAYRDELAGMFPPYRRALQAWAGPSQSLEAVQRGRQALRTDRDAVASAADRLSPSDQDFMRLGAGRAVSDMASDPARAPGAARRLLEDRQMQARLETLIPDQAQRETLLAALRQETHTAAVDRAVSPRAGSQTARLMAGAEDMSVDPPGGVLMSLLDAGQRGGVGGAVSRAGSMLYRRGQGMNSSTADALAERLFNMDPDARARTVVRLMERQLSDQTRAELQRALAARVLRGVGTTTAIEN